MASNASELLFCPDDDFPRTVQLFLLSLCLVCFVLAVGGNILVLLAVFKTRSLRNNSMYFLASLSFADLLVGGVMTMIYIVLLALFDKGSEVSDEFYFIIIRIENFVWVATLTATTFSLCSVSVDRYIAVSYALRYREIVTTQRCIIAIASIWLFAFGFAGSLFAAGTNIQSRKTFWVVCFSTSVGFPFTVLLFCNTKLALEARRQVRLIHSNSVHHTETQESSRTRTDSIRNRKATITAVIVAVIFFMLFFPQLVVFVMLLTTKDFCLEMKLQVVWYWVAVVSFYHSAANPWIYCIRSRDFRKAIKKQLLC